MTDADRKRAIELIRRWLVDDSGYDDAMWPVVKAGLNENRRAAGERLLFTD